MAARDAQFIDGDWPGAIAWTSFALVLCVTSRNTVRHLLSFSRPDLQPHVLRIIAVGPVYAFCAALCLSLDGEEACFFITAVRDVQEAVVIYSFLTLIIEYMGGEHLCLHGISQTSEDGVAHLFPLNLCLSPIPTGSMIRAPKTGVLQFVIVKPAAAIFSSLLYACGLFKHIYYQWTIFIVYNVSYTVALYALYIVYWATHSHPSLQSKRPLSKFLSVKMIVFLTFWQALLVPHLPLPGNARRWEDLLVSLEMVVFSLLMNAAFSWREFHSGLLLGSTSKSALAFRPSDADLIDLEAKPFDPNTPPATMFGAKKSDSLMVIKNARSAFCPSDVLDDATRNFSARYSKHVLIETAQEYELHAHEAGQAPDFLSGDAPPHGSKRKIPSGPPKVFRARTYLIGRSLGLPGDFGCRSEKAGEVTTGGAGSSNASTASPGEGSIASADTGDAAGEDWWSSASLGAQGPAPTSSSAALAAQAEAPATTVAPVAPPVFSGPPGPTPEPATPLDATEST